MTIEKLDVSTPDLTRQNIERLLELFPECRTEGSREDAPSVDFDMLRQALSDHLVEGPAERYRLDWPGKRQALLTANTPIDKTLRPMREESVDFDATRNLFIEGDNLDALKLLQETYLGKIKMIYVDPPYNTGSDFIYRDNFLQSREDYEEGSGQRDYGGGRLVANPESNGRFHSDWMNMIFPRLKLAWNILERSGAIFISCDEGEMANLKCVANGVFGETNFIAEFVWAAGKKNDSRLVSVSHEYILCYARDAQYLKEKGIEWRQRKKGLDEIHNQFTRLKRQHGTDYDAMTQGMKDWFKNLADGHPAKAHKHYAHVDRRGIYFPDNISWPGGGGPKYEVLHPKTKKPVKIPSRGWMTSDPNKMQSWIEDDRVHFGDDESKVPCIKAYLADRENQTPYSVFYQDGRAASKRLRALMEGDYFEFPKDELVLQELVEMLTENNDIVLDFFAGSGTIAHAVMAQNAKDGGQRPFFVVQLNEEVSKDTDAFEAGFKSIADLSRERIRRAAATLVECDDGLRQKLDTGFRSFRIDSGNFVDTTVTSKEATQEALLGMVSHIKDDRSDEDLLFGALLRWGVDITLPIVQRELAGRTVWLVDAPEYGSDKGAALIACFAKPGSSGKGGIDTELADAMAELAPLRVLFRDDGFADDATKENVHSRFQQRAPDTQIRVL